MLKVRKIIHDINSPLTSVIGYSQLLERKLPEGKEKEWSRKLHEDSLRLKDLMLELSDTVPKPSD